MDTRSPKSVISVCVLGKLFGITLHYIGYKYSILIIEAFLPQRMNVKTAFQCQTPHIHHSAQ